MKKKIVISLLLVIGLFLITGCNNDEELDALKGKWKASIEHQNVYQVDDAETIGGKDDYILECDGKGNYTITISDTDAYKGSYTIDDNSIIVKDDVNMVIGMCTLVSNKEIDCKEQSHYAYKYTKIK